MGSGFDYKSGLCSFSNIEVKLTKFSYPVVTYEHATALELDEMQYDTY